jgi:hypothetical protein
MFGLWRRRACHPSTRVALSLLQLGYLDKAQVRRHSSSTSSSSQHRRQQHKQHQQHRT